MRWSVEYDTLSGVLRKKREPLEVSLQEGAFPHTVRVFQEAHTFSEVC